MKGIRRAAPCLVGSVAAHAALVLAFALAHAHGGQGALPGPSHALQVRLALPHAATPPPASRVLPAAPRPSAAEPASQAPAAPTSTASLPIVPAPAPAPDLKKPRYYLPSELTERPRLAAEANPDMSLSVPDVPAQDVELRLLINRDGTVDEVVIDRADTDQRIKDAVAQAFSHLTFVPGKLHDMMVNSQVRIQVRLDAAVDVVSSVAVH